VKAEAKKPDFVAKRGFLASYCKRAHRMLGKVLDSRIHMLPDVGGALRQGDLAINTGAYVSAAILTMIIAFVASLSALVVVGLLLGYPILFIFSFMALPITFGAFYMYPSYRASTRKANIDENMPFAVSAMATMAGSGANTLDMFRTIAQGNRYGEMSREALKVVSDVENLGYTIKSALERAIERTPSAKLRALNYKIISTMMSGGDLKSLLMIQAEKVVDDTKREQEAAVEALGMVSEAYTVILILGPVLALVMSVIMMLLLPTMEPMMKMLQYALLMMVPVGYVVFTIMTSAIKPNL
jgi:flagellar protein FlaJ